MKKTASPASRWIRGCSARGAWTFTSRGITTCRASFSTSWSTRGAGRATRNWKKFSGLRWICTSNTSATALTRTATAFTRVTRTPGRRTISGITAAAQRRKPPTFSTRKQPRWNWRGARATKKEFSFTSRSSKKFARRFSICCGFRQAGTLARIASRPVTNGCTNHRGFTARSARLTRVC